MDILSVKQRFGIIGTSLAIENALEVAIRVAPTDLSVLVTGESGVGKEFFPQVIHQYSPRKHSKYIAVNCGAIPEGTIDSELFGHEKGSFTGASESRKGYFEEANGGTLFLDEVAELPHSTQVRLLRVLQTGEYIRVGSSTVKKTNVRVIAATNTDLQRATASGKFREDLYYRLNTVPIHVPPLRERREDIYLLFRRFAADVASQYRMPPISLDEGARSLLESYSWPGNVRQLKNVAEQISAVEESRVIGENTLRRYLPEFTAPGVMLTGQGGGAWSDERELLYKVLFDMRGDIFDLKRMLGELMGYARTGDPVQERGGEIAVLRSNEAFLPRPAVAPVGEEPQFADSEEVLDEPERTKEQAMRESIQKALKKHNGKRKEVAKELFMSERTLYRKMKELNIDSY